MLSIWFFAFWLCHTIQPALIWFPSIPCPRPRISRIRRMVLNQLKLCPVFIHHVQWSDKVVYSAGINHYGTQFFGGFCFGSGLFAFLLVYSEVKASGIWEFNLFSLAFMLPFGGYTDYFGSDKILWYSVNLQSAVVTIGALYPQYSLWRSIR